MDTNPFANNDAQQQTPSYLQQTNNPSMAGAASNMVKALMAGNQQFQAKQGANPMGAAGDGQWVGTSSVGGAPLAGYSGVTPGQAPMPQAAPAVPPQTAQGMQGGVPMGSPSASPFMTGAPPATVDPVTQALMSPIPGM